MAHMRDEMPQKTQT